jgi:hypothetical protein
MFRTIVKHTRPNTSVEFFNPKNSSLVSDETRLHIRNNYIVTGKIVHSEEVISEDGLSMTITAIFQNEATYNEWMNDTIITEQLRGVGNSYREANGISSVIESEETI